MRKFYLTLISTLVLAIAALAQTVTVNCTGSAGTFNSGYVTALGAKFDGNLTVAGTGSLSRGWTTFDLSSIPAGSTVNSVSLKFTVISNNAASTVNNGLYGFTGIPASMASGTLYNSCMNGTNFNNSAWVQNTTNTLAFNAAGITYITGTLGAKCNIGFVRGAGSAVFNIGGYAAGLPPQLIINYTPPAYRAQFISMNTGASTWCSGETRTVSVTVKNVGTATWTNASPNPINIGLKWNINGTNWADYYVRTSAANLAPGATGTYSFTIAASNNIGAGYTTGLAAGTNNLAFDVVREGIAWFGNNNAGVGPGNTVFTSPAITISALPGIPTGSATQTFCSINNPTVADLAATGTNINWYIAATGGTPLSTATPLLNGTHYYASQTNAAGCESTTRLDVTATINNSAVPTGSAVQTFCIVSNPAVASLSASGTAIKWYTVSSGGAALLPGTPLVNGAHYYASQTQSGCESAARLDVSVILNDAVAPTGAANQSFCAIDSPLIADLSVSGTAVSWYNSSTGGTGLATTTALTNGTHYFASQVIGGCESAARLDVLVAIQDPVAPSGAALQSFCASNNPTIADISATGSSINWYNAPVAGSLLSTATPLINGAHYYASQTISGCEGVARLDVTINVNQPVNISNQPSPATQAICNSFPATITVSATGDIAGYQWYLGSSPLTNNANISGSQSAQLAINQVSPADAGLYHVLISAVGGCTNVVSQDAFLAVDQNINITGQPTPQTTCSGGTASFTVVVSGTGMSYKWRKGAAYLIDGGNISGATTATLTITNVSAGDAGNYNVEINDGSSLCPVVYSNNAALIFNATSVGGVVNGSVSGCPGMTSGIVSLAGETGNILYWEYSTDGGASWSTISNTTNNQSYTNLTQTTLYRAVVKNGVCVPANASPVTISIYPTPVASATPSTQAICSANPITPINLTSNVTGTTYSWTRDNSFAVTGIASSGTGNISGSLTNTTSAPITVSFTITATANGCVGIPVIATVLVNPSPVAMATPASQVTCAGSPINNILLSSSTSGTSYNWTRDNNAGVTGIAASGSGNIGGTLTNITSLPLTVSFAVTPSANGCNGSSILATVLVNPKPVAVASPASQQVCSGNTITTISLSSATPGTSYTWTRNNTGTVTGIAANGNGNISGLLSNSTAFPVTVSFTIIPTANSCPGDPVIATVLVNPSPNVVRTPTTQNICSGSNIIPIVLSGSTPGTTYTWTRNNTASVTGIPASGSGDISGSLTNNTAVLVNVTFTVTASANGCVGTPAIASVLVYPTPVITATPANQVICSGVPVSTVAFSSATSGVSYTWTRDNTLTATGIPAGGSGNITGTFTNVTAVPVMVTFTVNSISNGCPGVPVTATVLVNPRPVAWAITGPNNVCIGSSVTLVSNATGIAPFTYTWASSNNAVASVNNAGVVTGNGTGTTNITYTVTDATGCSASSNTFAVTVTKPTANAITAPGSIVCVASTITLTPHATGSGTLTYTWSSSNNSIATVNNSGIVTGAGAGTANITYTVADGNGCPSTSPAYPVTVNAIPTGTLTAVENSGTANDNVICTGTLVKFTATAGYGSYIFKVDGITVQSGTLNVYNTTTLANGSSVTVEVANGFNCGTIFGPVNITVNPSPAPTLSSNKTVICPGENVVFTASGGSNYVFKINSSAVQSGVSNTYSSNSLLNGSSVTVDVTNANGCNAVSAPVVITVNTLPTGTLTTSATNTCAGNSVTFTATPGYANYNFTVNGTSVQIGSSNSFTSTTLANPSVVAMEVTNAAGCMAGFGPVAVTVNALPTGTLTASENSGTSNDNTICAGTAVNFIATAGFANYDFRINGVSVQNGPGQTYVGAAFTNGDLVTVEVRNSNNCSAVLPGITITVLPVPTGTLTASAATICAGENVTFTATPGFVNYNFIVNGLTVQNGSSSIFTSSTLANGNVVTVEVTNSNACKATFTGVTMIVHTLPSGSLTFSENSGIAANDGVICTGANVSFGAPPGYANYDFLVNGISIQNGTSNTFNTTSLSNGDQVSVVVTNPAGCIALLNSILITVHQYPVGSPITGIPDVCVGSTSTLVNTVVGGSWSSDNSSIATVNASGVVTGISGGTVTITYTVTNSNNCSTVVSATVIVHDLPAIAPITGPLNVCAGNTTTLSSTTTGGTWSSDNVAIATVSNTGIVTGITAGNATISYTVVNAENCSNTSSVSITVNALPVLTPVTGNLNLCAGSTSLLANTVAGGSWSSNNSSVATVNASTGLITGISAGNATITYTITNAMGCSTAVTANAVVYALPVPTLSGPNPICPNSTGTYTTEPGQFNYDWTFTGGTLIAGGTNTDNTITIQWDQPGPKTIYVNYRNADGCYGATSATVTTSTGTVPSLAGVTAICLNEATTYVTQAGESNYTWSVSGGNITAGGTTTDNAVTISWNTAGTGSVGINFTDVNGCTGIAQTILPVNVHPLPEAMISGTTSVCLNSPSPVINFTGTSGTAPYTFTYTINGGPAQVLTTVSGNSITVSVPTGTPGSLNYELVQVSDANGCTQLQSGMVTVTVNELPTASINGSVTICQNSSAPAISFSGNSGTAPFIFSYTINGGPIQSVSTSSGNIATVFAATNTAGNFTYNLVNVTDANGCTQAQPGSAVVTVNPSPAATINGTATICQGSASPIINFTGTGGTAPYIFTYTINGGPNQLIISTGNTALLSVPTVSAGVYQYSLVSIQDASVSTCSRLQGGSVTITVDATTVAGTVSSNAVVCAGINAGSLTLSGHNGIVQYWQYSVDGGVSWTNISNTTSALTYNNLTATTLYRAVVQNGSCTAQPSGIATITVNNFPVGGQVSADAVACSGTNNGTLNLTGYTGTITRWEFSTNGGVSWTAIANTTPFQNYANLLQTTIYRAVVGNGVCTTVNSNGATITVNPLPTATVSGTRTVCLNDVAPLISFTGASGVAPYTFTYSINGGATTTIVSTGNTATVAVPTTAAGVFTYTLVSVQSAGNPACAQNQGGSASITVNALPTPFILTPASAAICQGSVQSLTASGYVATTGSVTFSSGTINLAIPELGNRASTIAVSGIPAGAVINRVDVNFNITHGYDDDLVINLKAPNGNTLNLVNERGGSGDNFTNSTVSSASINPLNSGVAPFSNTYAADAANNVGIPASNVNAFSSLYGTPNGNWVFNASDLVDCHGSAFACFFGFGSYYTGVLNSWNITINYTVPNAPLNVVWTPSTALYTDPGATIAYTGQPIATVYTKPIVPGNITYTATSTNAGGCNHAQNVSLTVSPKPAITITADYCSVPGKVLLTANATPAASNYIWSTGETTQSIEVDVAGIFDVTAYAGAGCPGMATINVAQELIVNGDFELGNTGFSSGYGYINNTIPDGMQPESKYTVNNNANFNHTNFWGHDHSSGNGNFMIINGAGSPVNVWTQTLNVLPNTTYYFSAWAMSLNNVPPFAQLQFNVNGTLVGSTAVLAGHGQSAASPDNWMRFYGTWTSGPTTTQATVSITDLQTAYGGNDFGIDDISFATLSTFISLESAPGTDAQTVCENSPIQPIEYNVGNGSATGPILTGLPAGVTSVFTGDHVTISGTPTIAGNYNYTLTTTGNCQPMSATGTITVQDQDIRLTSGSSSTTVCVNVPLNVQYTISGSTTGAVITGLPAGVTASLSGNIYSISGAATTAGSYPYMITTTGNCIPVTVNGLITVQSQTIALNSANATQTICINNAITNIQYTVGGTGTGINITGLPPGLSYSYNSGILFISGTATVAGTFNYSVNTTGNCTPVSANGTITVTANPGITLTSGIGSNAQTICVNNPVAGITYSVNNATGATITGLPPGITGTYNSGIFNISGTATMGGTFNYVISSAGGCGITTAMGTISVQSQSIALTSGNSSPTICMNTSLPGIIYTLIGNATGATVTGLPAGINFSVSGTTLTINGTATVPGSFPYTIATTGNCSPAIASGTITVQPGANGGSLASVSICSGSSGNLTLTGHSGSVSRWETSIDGGLSWVSIANTTITQSYTNITIPTQYRVMVSNGCGAVFSPVGTVGIHNYWTGNTSSDWNTPSNWSDNLVPSLSCNDVYIHGGRPHQPLLSSGSASIHNLQIFSGATLTVDNSILKISGNINNSGVFIAVNGSIEMKGSAPQNIPVNCFKDNAVANIVINNSSPGGVILSGELNVYQSVTYVGVGKKFHTNDHLTLKSTATETAWLGDMTGNTITGDVTVERYIATGNGAAPLHGKSWQLLAVPTTGQTLKQSWQEGATTVNGNPHPGYGTMLTSNVPNAATQPNPGFDVFTASGPSIKIYNTANGAYVGPASTNIPVYNKKGYFILVRGDRSVTAFNQPANSTVLRTKGTLFTPSNPPPATTVAANKFESIGNPYPSALDLRLITHTGGMDEFYYVWDPRLGGASSMGAFQTLYKMGANYYAIPGGGSYGSGTTNFIQSGQAFLAHASGTAGMISFTESAKANGSTLLLRPNEHAPAQKLLGSRLYGVNPDGSVQLLDGTLHLFAEQYSNATDGADAKKSENTGENLSIKTEAGLLTLDRRHPLNQNDTLLLNLSGVRVQTYRLEFTASELSDGTLKGFVEDKYLNTRTPLVFNGTTVVDFKIENIPGSYSPDRFRIVFRRAAALPVTYTSIEADSRDTKVDVTWQVENEMNIKHYELQRSANGSLFTAIGVKGASGNNTPVNKYVLTDSQPIAGLNYYRIMSVDEQSKAQYTSIVKVDRSMDKAGISVFPNPITNGLINIRLHNQPAGLYQIKLLNKLGQVILSRQVNHAEGSSTEQITWNYELAHGMYHLEITQPDKQRKIIKVMY